MTDKPTDSAAAATPAPKRRTKFTFAAVVIAVALATSGVTALLVNMYTRKAEERQPFVRLVEVNELTTNPAEWGKNWPREYDAYQRTSANPRTTYGGSEAMPVQKLDRDPWLKRMYAGYAFSIDFRDRRGHAFMLFDQEHTERITKKPQPGACLHCHASATTTWRRLGLADEGKTLVDVDPYDFNWPAVMKGFEKMCAMSYTDAHAQIALTPDGTNFPPSALHPLPKTGPTTKATLEGHEKLGTVHPVACIDCHDPRTMALRVTRPGFINGIKALKAHEGKKDYDPNRDATRQEMRSFVCGQCHVEYYCGPKLTLFFPWGNGLKVEEIESYYNDVIKFSDGHRFYDWQHGETGAELLKAQHPEFEMFNQGTHAKAGVACADCHMPYVREGAMKVSDHQVRSPATMINRSCQVCHPVPEAELKDRITTIQTSTHDLLGRSSVALVDMLDAIKLARQAGATPDQLKPIFELQRKAQWRLDFVSSENSMGFHAPQESARILAESIDYSRQAVSAAQSLHLNKPANPAPVPEPTPVQGVTPEKK